MRNTLVQLAQNTNLLPEEERKAILSGHTRPLADLIQHLVIGSMDVNAVAANDKTTTWPERRIARQLLINTFLAALLLERTLEPEQERDATTAPKEERS
ncbi:MAG: hypothetical protein ABSB35_33160 [Bryobacteraceae bacterium]|jgi:hypothetical protein